MKNVTAGQMGNLELDELSDSDLLAAALQDALTAQREGLVLGSLDVRQLWDSAERATVRDATRRARIVVADVLAGLAA